MVKRRAVYIRPRAIRIYIVTVTAAVKPPQWRRSINAARAVPCWTQRTWTT
jgi:hypothetical protein